MKMPMCNDPVWAARLSYKYCSDEAIVGRVDWIYLGCVVVFAIVLFGLIIYLSSK